MTKNGLYENLLEEALIEDEKRISSHAYWMAQLLGEISKDPAFKKLNPSNRDQVEQILTAIE